MLGPQPDSQFLGGLKWVKGEIVTSLERIRDQVERCGQDPSPEPALSVAITGLTETRGVLLALQLHGAARLVDELRQSCEQLAAGSIDSSGDAVEALALALIQLPDHLDRIDSKKGESTLSLLPAINDVRASRGDPLLSAAELLVPRSVLAIDQAPSAESLEQTALLVRKARPHLYQHLLEWLRGQDPNVGLRHLARLFNQLHRFLGEGPLSDLFRGAEQLVNGLLGGAVATRPNHRKLIGELDEVLKPLTRDPPLWPAQQIERILCELIACLAEDDLDPSLAAELSAAYGGAADLGAAQPATSPEPEAPGGDVLATLAARIREALDPIEARLDQFVRLGRFQSTAWMADFHPQLVALADELDTVNCAELARCLAQQGETLAAIGRGELPPEEDRLLALAADMLAVQAAVATLEATRNPVRAQAALKGVDRDELAATTLREATTELNRAKQAIDDGTEKEGGDLQRLSEVPALLLGTAGALKILGQPAAAELLDNLVNQWDQRYLEPALIPTQAELGPLAEALSSIELFIDGLLEEAPYRTDLLAQGRDALERLSAMTPEQRERSAPAQAPADMLDGASAATVDADLRDIFFEEAHEEGKVLAEQFARWRQDHNDEIALGNLRRSFHTLKGSGRLVGATQVAELARASEAVLNRVIDQGLGTSEELIEAVGEAAALVPELITAEADARQVATAPLLDRLASLIDPRPVEPAAAPHDAAPATEVAARPPEAATTSVPAEAADSASPPSETVSVAVDPELAELFLEDARELMERLEEGFRGWRDEPDEPTLLAEIQRQLHTLKGAARLAELKPIADLSHGLETFFIELATQEAIGTTQIDVAQRAVDTLSSQVDALGDGRPLPYSKELLAGLTRALRADEPESPEVAPQPATIAPPEPPATATPEPTSAAAAKEGSEAEASVTYLRIRSDLLNQLIDQAAEMRIDREQLVRHNGGERAHLDELERTLERLRGQLRYVQDRVALHGRDHDELAEDWDAEAVSSEGRQTADLPMLLHGLTETVADLKCIDELLGNHQRETTELLDGQASKVSALLDGLLNARMVPFRSLQSRLERVVRQAARDTGKRADLEIAGGDVELDRSILERLLGPFEHLLRNALAHGIETPAVREADGKPGDGAIRLEVGRDGNDIVVNLSDDGAGMDTAAIRRKALARGLIADDTEISDDELIQLTLEPGFSTATEVTQLAGRGVGLDAVMAEVRQVNGSLTLRSRRGQGMHTRIRVPLTLAMIDVLLVEVGDQIHAVPYTTIEGVARIDRNALRTAYGQREPEYGYRGRRYRLVHLGSLLDPAAPPEIGRRRGFPLLLLRSGEQGYALQVDGLREGQRIVVKPLGPLLSALRTMSGGTILPDGRVALVLDLPALLRSPAMSRYSTPEVELDSITTRDCVMVVDDSLTTRRANSDLLRAQGLDVITAKDGVEALALLEERVPDLFMLDIDMPRMDGYELTRHIRRSAHWGKIPIIVSSSRSSAEHLERCQQLGITRCLGKPYDPNELITVLEELLQGATP